MKKKGKADAAKKKTFGAATDYAKGSKTSMTPGGKGKKK